MCQSGTVLGAGDAAENKTGKRIPALVDHKQTFTCQELLRNSREEGKKSNELGTELCGAQWSEASLKRGHLGRHLNALRM